jgi:hypothetical protein
MNLLKYNKYLIKGFAQCFNMFPAIASAKQFGYKEIPYKEIPYKEIPYQDDWHLADSQNLKNDWKRVGDCIRFAMKSIDNEVISEKTKK